MTTHTINDYLPNDLSTNDWMDCILKEEPSSDSELSITSDDPGSPIDHELFWLNPTENPSIGLEMDEWTRSPFEMDDFIVPDFPPPRLTCPLVSLRRVTPPKAEPPAQPQSWQAANEPQQLPALYPLAQYHPLPASVFPTTLLPQAQVFSLSSPNAMPIETNSFGGFDSLCLVPTHHRPAQLNCDISRTLSNAKYSELFTTCGNQLLVDRHPQFTLQDINSVLKTGYLYFLKNVKTIVPRIGQEWRFISHVRAPGPGESSDRSYNLLGPIPLRCKVKEWIVGPDLWRMYHFVQGKTKTKQSPLS